MASESRENLIRILRYFDISFEATSKKTINTQCPFCDDQEAHCGIYYDREFWNFTCFKCKSSGGLFDLLHELNGLGWDEYKQLLNVTKTISNDSALQQIQNILKQETQSDSAPRQVIWPPDGTIPLSVFGDDALVMSFMRRRNLNFEMCCAEDVRIGVVGRWTGRFIFPIKFNGNIVAFQGRDMTNKTEPRYLTEGDITNFLYRFNSLDDRFPIIITEGVFDCWEVGYNCTSTFSAALSVEQIKLMSHLHPPYWVLCWDIGIDGSDAFWKGRKVVQAMSSIFGADVRYVQLPPREDASSLGHDRITQLIAEAVPFHA